MKVKFLAKCEIFIIISTKTITNINIFWFMFIAHPYMNISQKMISCVVRKVKNWHFLKRCFEYLGKSVKKGWEQLVRLGKALLNYNNNFKCCNNLQIFTRGPLKDNSAFIQCNDEYFWTISSKIRNFDLCHFELCRRLFRNF